MTRDHLATLREAKDHAAGALQRLQTEMADTANDAALCQFEPSGPRLARRVLELAEALKDVQAEADNTASWHDEAERQILLAEDIAQRQAEVEQNLHRQSEIPRLAADCLAQAHEIDRLASELATQMKSHLNTSGLLAAALEDTEASRELRADVIMERWQRALNPMFDYYPASRPTAVQFYAGTRKIGMLDWRISPTAPRATESFAQVTQGTLDRHARLWASPDEARTAIQRLGAVGRLFIAPAVRGLFTLQSGALRSGPPKDKL